MSLSLSCRRPALVVTVAAVLCCAWAARADAHVYWTNFNGTTIGRANLDRTDLNQNFITAGNHSAAVAVDGSHVYWANHDAGTIGRADLDGTDPNQNFITGANSPVGVAVDAQHVYWANYDGGTIGRANLDGTGAKQDFITGADHPAGVAVGGQHVYWTSWYGGTIGRANLDGTGAKQDFIAAASFPAGVAVDGQHVYWINSGSGAVGRANLDGTGVKQDFITGASDPRGLAVDGQHVYWTSFTAGTVGRANLDGSDPDQNFITGADSPFGVAVDGGPAGSASAGATSLAFATQPLATLGAPTSLTVTNTGHGNLHIDTARVASGDVDDFLISYDSCSSTTVAPGQACRVNLRFAPSAAGDRHATLTVTSDDPNGPLRIQLNGTAGDLPAGPPGAAGATGAIGATGATGAPGAQGPPGSPGQVRLVTCNTVRVKSHGRHVERARCTTRLIAGTATFTTTGTARASLSRNGVTYATGTATRSRLVMTATRDLAAGRYTLTLRTVRHGHRVTTRTLITIR